MCSGVGSGPSCQRGSVRRALHGSGPGRVSPCDRDLVGRAPRSGPGIRARMGWELTWASCVRCAASEPCARRPGGTAIRPTRSVPAAELSSVTTMPRVPGVIAVWPLTGGCGNDGSLPGACGAAADPRRTTGILYCSSTRSVAWGMRNQAIDHSSPGAPARRRSWLPSGSRRRRARSQPCPSCTDELTDPSAPDKAWNGRSG